MSSVSASAAEPTVAASRSLRAAILLALLFAFALLLAAASGDLWLDEIWSIDLASKVGTPWDIFATLHHDNNHPLNTLYLYLLGAPNALLSYRLAAVLSGMGCLSLIGYTAWKQWSEREALLAIVLTAVCFPILLYSSEARGYAPAMMLAVAAYVAWRRQMANPGKISLLVFWMASALGLLAHGTFVIVVIAFALGQLAEERGTSSFSQRVFNVAKVHQLPMLFVAWWYWFFLRNMHIGGGDPSGGWKVIGQTASLLLGLPDAPAFHLVAMAGALSLLLVGVRHLWAVRDGQWLFFLSVLLIAPAMLLAFSYPHNFYFRYFLVSFPFFLLLSSRLVCVGWQRFNNDRRGLLALGIAIFLAGNFQRDYFLLDFGRGKYSAATEYMFRQTPHGPVSIGSDNDFRNSIVLEFYASRRRDGDRLLYVGQSQLARHPPEWFLLHSQDLSYIPPPQIGVKDAGTYSLDKRFGFAGVSGFSWFVYRRSP
jgi:hypothetical protein